MQKKTYVSSKIVKMDLHPGENMGWLLYLLFSVYTSFHNLEIVFQKLGLRLRKSYSVYLVYTSSNALKLSTLA